MSVGIGTAPPAELELVDDDEVPSEVPVVEVRLDHDDVDPLVTADGELDLADEDDNTTPIETPLVQARRHVVDTDPLDQARRFEMVRQSIAERSAARRFELAVDPPDAPDAPVTLATPTRGATC